MNLAVDIEQQHPAAVARDFEAALPALPRDPAP
jgi:hypothetical protein